MYIGQLLGSSGQSSFYAGVDTIYGHCDNLALFSRKLGEDIALEAAQHQRLVKEQPQLSEVRRARVVPPPSRLEERDKEGYRGVEIKTINEDGGKKEWRQNMDVNLTEKPEEQLVRSLKCPMSWFFFTK